MRLHRVETPGTSSSLSEDREQGCKSTIEIAGPEEPTLKMRAKTGLPKELLIYLHTLSAVL